MATKMMMMPKTKLIVNLPRLDSIMIAIIVIIMVMTMNRLMIMTMMMMMVVGTKMVIKQLLLYLYR